MGPNYSYTTKSFGQMIHTHQKFLWRIAFWRRPYRTQTIKLVSLTQFHSHFLNWIQEVVRKNWRRRGTETGRIGKSQWCSSPRRNTLWGLHALSECTRWIWIVITGFGMNIGRLDGDRSILHCNQLRSKPRIPTCILKTVFSCTS